MHTLLSFCFDTKRNKKVKVRHPAFGTPLQREAKFLTLNHFENTHKITLNPIRLRASAVQGLAILWYFLHSFTKFYKARATPFIQYFYAKRLLHCHFFINNAFRIVVFKYLLVLWGGKVKYQANLNLYLIFSTIHILIKQK